MDLHLKKQNKDFSRNLSQLILKRYYQLKWKYLLFAFPKKEQY